MDLGEEATERARMADDRLKVIQKDRDGNRAGLERKAQDAERRAEDLRQSGDRANAGGKTVDGELRASLATAEEKYAVQRETEQSLHHPSESYESAVETRDERIVQRERACTARTTEGSGVALLKVEIGRLHREVRVSTGSVAKDGGESARSQEQVVKLEAEDGRLGEVANRARRVGLCWRNLGGGMTRRSLARAHVGR